jgi:hypothetical protein
MPGGKKYRVGVIAWTDKGNYGLDTVRLNHPRVEVVAVAPPVWMAGPESGHGQGGRGLPVGRQPGNRANQYPPVCPAY